MSSTNNTKGPIKNTKNVDNGKNTNGATVKNTEDKIQNTSMEKLETEITRELSKTCTSFSKLNIVKNVIRLLDSGLENNLRAIVKTLEIHGNDTKIIVKDDKTTFGYMRDFATPATNIAYMFGPISAAIWKKDIDLGEIKEYQEKTQQLAKNLKEAEKLGIQIIANNKISTAEVPSRILKGKLEIETRKAETTKKQTKKAELPKKEDEKKHQTEVERTKKMEEVRLLKEQKKKEKQEAHLKRQEEMKKERAEFIDKVRALYDTNPKPSDKTDEEWKVLAKELKLKVDDNLPIFESIENIMLKVLKINLENKEESLPAIETKLLTDWKDFAKEKNIDLQGKTTKEDIYETIKKELNS